jgi:hypothetical protein
MTYEKSWTVGKGEGTLLPRFATTSDHNSRVCQRRDKPPAELAATNRAPKTVMGSGIAPPRLSKIAS